MRRMFRQSCLPGGNKRKLREFFQTDYDSAESTHSNLSFIHQMKKAQLDDEVIKPTSVGG